MKVSLIQQSIKEYKKVNPDSEIKVFVPIKEKGEKEYDLLILDKTKKCLIAIKVKPLIKATSEIVDLKIEEVRTEYWVWNKGRFIAKLTKGKYKIGTEEESCKIKEEIAKLLNKINKVLEEDLETEQEVM